MFADEHRRVVQANSEGTRLEFERIGLIFMVQVTARRGDVLQTGYEPVGGQWGMELFDRVSAADVASRAASRALMMLGAREAPFGQDAGGPTQ